MALRRRHALGTAAALALVACRSSYEPSPAVVPSSAAAPTTSTAAPSVPVPAAVSAPPGPLPLDGAPLVPLAVAGYGAAVVSVPLGATTPRRLALALHGNFDRPEWQCEVWRRITRGEVFVLCPRGVPRRDVPKELDRWEWGSVAKTKAELLVAIAALRERYGERVAPAPIVFTGFSLGAILGATLIRDPELRVGAAVLVEGGYAGWTASKAKALKPSLRYLLIGCGQTDCRNAYRFQLGPLLERASLPASMVADVKAGHTYDDPVAALLQQEWPNVLNALEGSESPSP